MHAYHDIEVLRVFISDTIHYTHSQDMSVVLSQPAECPPHQAQNSIGGMN